MYWPEVLKIIYKFLYEVRKDFKLWSEVLKANRIFKSVGLKLLKLKKSNKFWPEVTEGSLHVLA